MRIDLEKQAVIIDRNHEDYVKEAGGVRAGVPCWLTGDEWTTLKQLEAAALQSPITIRLVDSGAEDVFATRAITDICIIAESCSMYQVLFSFTDPARADA